MILLQKTCKNVNSKESNSDNSHTVTNPPNTKIDEHTSNKPRKGLTHERVNFVDHRSIPRGLWWW